MNRREGAGNLMHHAAAHPLKKAPSLMKQKSSLRSEGSRGVHRGFRGVSMGMGRRRSRRTSWMQDRTASPF